MEKKQIHELLVMVGAMYSTLQISIPVIEVWHLAIGHLDYETALKAIKIYLQTSTFEPKAADILKIVEGIRDKRKKTPGQLWLISKNIAHTGKGIHRNALKDQYPVAFRAVLQVGGFEKLGHMVAAGEDLTFIRKDWLRFYEDLARNEKSQEVYELADSTVRTHVKLITAARDANAKRA